MLLRNVKIKNLRMAQVGDPTPPVDPIWTYSDIISQSFNPSYFHMTTWTATHDSTNYVYLAGTGGRIFRTTNPESSSNWEGLRTPIPGFIRQAKFNSTTGTHIAATSLGLLRSTNGTTWSYVDPGGGSLDWSAAGHNDSNTWVIGSTNGTLRVSTDNGLNWSAATSGTSNTISGIDYLTSESIWVYVSNGSGIRSATNPSGTWTSRVASGGFLGLGKDGTVLIATSSGGSVRRSENGTSWSTPSSGTTQPLYWSHGSSGNWRAVGGNGATRHSSDSGVTWPDGATVSGNPILRSITTLGSSWITAGEGASLATSSTPTGAWTLRKTGSTSAVIAGFAGDLSQSVICGNEGMLLSGPYGNWTVRNSNQTGLLRHVTRNPSGTWVAVGSGGIISSSTNGIDWTPRTSNTTQDLNWVTWGNNLFVTVGLSGTVRTSPDGVTWASHSTPFASLLRTIAWSGTEWLIGADAGVVYRSTNVNASSWTTVSGPSSGNPGFSSVVWTGTNWILGATNGVIRTSAGSATTTWTDRTTQGIAGTISRMIDIPGQAGKVIAVSNATGYGGSPGAAKLIISNDHGATWSDYISPQGQEILGLSYDTAGDGTVLAMLNRSHLSIGRLTL